MWSGVPTIQDVLNRARETYTVIVGPGENDHFTGNAGDTGLMQLIRFLSENCPDEDQRQDLLGQIWDIADQGYTMGQQNELPTTNPKCFSKPIIKLQAGGCGIAVEWAARSSKEVQCVGPGFYEPKT